ncbi:MAG: hypothetical protein ABSH51_14445 [Solirubrobacteraceae bacterium]
MGSAITTPTRAPAQADAGAPAHRRPPAGRRPREMATGVVAALVAAWAAGPALAAAPLSLPGPPPSFGTALPLPPAPGQAPSPTTLGGATTLPSAANGPGLLGPPIVRGRTLIIDVACHSGGRAVLRAPALSFTSAPVRYRCRQSAARIGVTLPVDAARGLSGLGSSPATLEFIGAGANESVTVLLSTATAPVTTWTSDFGLSCSTTADQATLTAPNFTDTGPTTIDVRPWLAWYTPANGWHWVGTDGGQRSQWYQWTSIASGVAEWQTPAGQITPWTWSPISILPGDDTTVVAVFEAIYWYERPEYVWSYARSTEDGVAAPYCTFP